MCICFSSYSTFCVKIIGVACKFINKILMGFFLLCVVSQTASAQITTSDVQASSVSITNYRQCYDSSATASQTTALVSNGNYINEYFCVNKRNQTTILSLDFNNTQGKQLKSILLWNSRYRTAFTKEIWKKRRLASFKLRVHYLADDGTTKITAWTNLTSGFSADMRNPQVLSLPVSLQVNNPTKIQLTAMTNAAPDANKYNDRVMAREIQLRIQTSPNPSIQVVKTSSATGPVQAGDTITYIITMLRMMVIQ